MTRLDKIADIWVSWNKKELDADDAMCKIQKIIDPEWRNALKKDIEKND